MSDQDQLSFLEEHDSGANTRAPSCRHDPSPSADESEQLELPLFQVLSGSGSSVPRTAGSPTVQGTTAGRGDGVGYSCCVRRKHGSADERRCTLCTPGAPEIPAHFLRLCLVHQHDC
jgi:hypothetical protein